MLKYKNYFDKIYYKFSQIWNLFKITKLGTRMTNNISEDRNDRFRPLIQNSHLNIWIFLVLYDSIVQRNIYKKN